MSEKPLLQLEAIDKKFPGVHALDHVDFDLYKGETHVLCYCKTSLLFPLHFIHFIELIF
ncbi:unnamed protein product [marine sediment metagenome]|uniref:ABC transporter domain-containing protein n=1 Tax=marine sediment metagenome TaxID=412755 RepID=X1JT72_9ZZZZ